MKAHSLRSCLVALAAAAFLCSCAETYESSQDETTGPTSSDTQGSTGAETDIGNTDTDYFECTTGSDRPCCVDGWYANTQVVCDTDYRSEYTCDTAGGCGGAQLVRHQVRYCSGRNYSCGGAPGGFGQWEPASNCQPHEVCVIDVESDTNGEANTTDPDLLGCETLPSVCPISWGLQVCFEGGSMEDCPDTGCLSPRPSLHLEGSLTMDVDDVKGKAVFLKVFVKQRGGLLVAEPAPFNDIKAVLSHNDQSVPFYNFYDGNEVTTLTGVVYRFPNEWYLPDFWDMDMFGEWTLDFWDYAPTDPEKAFVVNEWCLTFVDPEKTVREGNGEWRKTPGPVAGALGNGTTVFEMQVDDYVEADDAEPATCLAIKAADPSGVRVEMVAADGTSYVLKQLGEEAIPQSVTLFGLSRGWLAGRYKLIVGNNNFNASTDGDRLVGWSVNYKTPCNLPDVPIDTDTGDTDSGTASDTGTGSDTGTSSDTGTGSDTGTSSDTGTGSDTGTSSDTGTGSETSDPATDTPEETITETGAGSDQGTAT